eukprot:2015200-Pyramimonas_sp.AAC.1
MALNLLTTQAPGLEYLSLMGPTGVDTLIVQLTKRSTEVAEVLGDIEVAKLLLAAAKSLESSKPPKK